MSILSVFLFNITLSVCLFISVCLRQNVLSMIHLIILICFPLFQTSNNLNVVIPPNKQPHTFIKTAFIVILIILLLKITNTAIFFTMPQYYEIYHSCDNIGQTLNILGFGNGSFDLTLDALLTVIFALFLYYMYYRDTSSDRNIDIYEKNYYFLIAFKYLCLAIVCMNGIIVPSLACCIYYVLFIIINTTTILFKLKDKTIAHFLRITCLYTCLHILILFTYQIGWVRKIDISLNLAKQFGLIAYHNWQCSPTEVLPELKERHYLLVVLLIFQHYLLWTYTNVIYKNTTVIHSTESNKLASDKFGFENIILVGIKTIGFKIIILIWSIYYRGWLTLTMLLWSTIAWIYLHSRRNIIISLLLAISTLLTEYAYIILGDSRLKQVFGFDLKTWSLNTRDDFPTTILIKTLFTITFWIALDQSDKKPDQIGLELWTENLKKYISFAWITSLISIMFAYGFFGYNNINYIRLGYISLTLLFFIFFQVSFEIWRKTTTIYWTVVVLYSIVVVTITYTFQFYGFAETLGNMFHISNNLQRDIGLHETGEKLIIVPSTISIATIVYLKYLHGYFMNTLEIKRQILFFDTIQQPREVQTETRLSVTRNVIILILHVHLNKLIMLLFVILLILNKPCLVNGVLLVMILLWTLSDYNNHIMRILFLYITLYLIVTIAYQFPYIDHLKWTIQYQYKEYGIFKLNVAELIGLKKYNSNQLLFNFLMYEMSILLAMVLKKIITVYLKFKHYPQQIPSVIFPNILYANMNSGLSEFIMYLANEGFSLFGLEITLTTIAITISLSTDVYGLAYALWLLTFALLDKRSISACWIYFITFVCSTVIFKYLLAIIYVFDLHFGIPWKNIEISKNLTITLYDMSYSAWIKPLLLCDFVLLLFASHLLTVFKNDRLLQRSGWSENRDLQETNIIMTVKEEYPDYMLQTKSYLDIFKRNVFNNSLWMILFFMFWISTNNNNVNLFSLGYLCAGTIFFWKGTYYYLMPLDKILKLWKWLLKYSILVILFKTLFHLLGCLILNNFQWYSCVFMRVLSMFCSQQSFETRHDVKCDMSKQDIGLFWDVCTFMLVLFQMRFFESGHFHRLVEDTKAVAALATKMGNVIKEWGRQKKDESYKFDIESLAKIKVKLKKILRSKEKRSKKQLNHSLACSDGEHMFDEIHDEVYLVEKHDTNSFSKYDDSVIGPWLYRQFVCFVLYLTEKINEYSKEHRKIVQTLYTEKKLLTLDKKNNANVLESDDQTQYEAVNKRRRHWLIQLISTLWNAGQSSTHLLCYISIFCNAVENYYNFISMIPVVMAMFWGQLSVPRPTKTFWIVLITYMQVTSLVKYICSFKEMPWIQEETQLQLIRTSDFYSYPTIQLGIGDYQNKIPTDIIVLLFLYLHRRNLITLGLWAYDNDNRERIATKKFQSDHEIKTSLRMIILNIKMHFTSVTEFYTNLRQYHTVGSVNVYPTMFILMAIQIPRSLINSQTTTEIFTLNRISAAYFGPILTYTITIVIDRWLYSRCFILGKLIFHIFFVCAFIFVSTAKNVQDENFLSAFWAYTNYLYIIVSAYQIRNGYLYRNASSFIWSRYTIFNLLAYKLYYYCPFVHEIRTVLDWICTDSSLSIMEWFKMEELFTHVCCVKCLCNLRNLGDTRRGQPLPRLNKLLIGGGIVIAISTIIIFPIAWFSMFVSTPDTPSSVEFTVTLGEDSTIFNTKSDDINRLDATDFSVIQKLYSNSSSKDRISNLEFLSQYQFDEISSVNVIPQSINTWSITPHEFNKFKKIIFTSSSIKVSVVWSLTHNDGVKISYGKNTVIMNEKTHSKLINCLQSTEIKTNTTHGRCEKLIVQDLIPKFLILHLKTTVTEVKSELMIHKPLHPYMDIGLTFHYNEQFKYAYFWDMVEICPTNEDAFYLKKMPYSSCADDDIKSDMINTNIKYNIYVFSGRFSDTLQFLDDKGIIGLYTIIVVYVGYKLAFDIFRSFKFKLGYTETPYPDRILQLCYEIYLVRSFEEYEMEEDLYAMLIFLFRSPETLIRFTRRPNT